MSEKQCYTKMGISETIHDTLTVPWHFAALSMLSITHIMPTLVLNTCMDANMQFTMNSFRHLFPDKIFPWHFLHFSKIPDISLRAVKFPDISRFSRQVVILYMLSYIRVSFCKNGPFLIHYVYPLLECLAQCNSDWEAAGLCPCRDAAAWQPWASFSTFVQAAVKVD